MLYLMRSALATLATLNTVDTFDAVVEARTLKDDSSIVALM